MKAWSPARWLAGLGVVILVVPGSASCVQNTALVQLEPVDGSYHIVNLALLSRRGTCGSAGGFFWAGHASFSVRSGLRLRFFRYR